MTQVTFKGKVFTLTTDPEETNLIMSGVYHDYDNVGDGEVYNFEMSSPATDDEGNECKVYWIFDAVKGQEKDDDFYHDLDYNNVNRVEYP